SSRGMRGWGERLGELVRRRGRHPSDRSDQESQDYGENETRSASRMRVDRTWDPSSFGADVGCRGNGRHLTPHPTELSERYQTHRIAGEPTRRVHLNLAQVT